MGPGVCYEVGVGVRRRRTESTTTQGWGGVSGRERDPEVRNNSRGGKDPESTE